MRPTWRLIVDPPTPGDLCMGIDTALLEARAAGACPATLRIYTWERPTVSIGRFQAEHEVDLLACEGAGIGVVRRPTGGRGVLHGREVTYSVVASIENGVPRDVAGSYSRLCGGLVEAYRALGVDAVLTARERGPRSAACYLHASRADVSAGRAKLSGSAQVWKGDSLLQHGSIVLERDIRTEAMVFRLREEERLALEAAAASVSEISGRTPCTAEVTAALAGGFAEALGVDLEAGELSAEELRRARKGARVARVTRHGEVRHRVEG